MSIIDRFLEDHRAFRHHLKKSFEIAAALPDSATPPPPSQEDSIFTHRLRRHARMEGELLFPAIQRAGTDEARQKSVKRYIDHGNDEHISVAKPQAEHQSAANNAPLERWRSTLQHFADGLERHMQLEEQEIFPLARELLTQDVLNDLNQKAEKIP
jgi:hemerythrin-like domain-containing protein